VRRTENNWAFSRGKDRFDFVNLILVQNNFLETILEHGIAESKQFPH
jgi:hypothetical protein